ncbi:MAG: hypothetical protein C5B51_02510 [Terriglobia bacterium]|nr:MAG: hypothetical protein C5B51_02510 [Terriglobia bacterium]
MVIDCVQSLTRKPDFPAFSDQIKKILAAAEDEEGSIRELTNLIIRDYSLTLKVLRAANCRNMSGRPIHGVAHAVMMLGTAAVRHLAGSLVIFEYFHNKTAGVRELMMLSMLTANHAYQIARRAPGISPEEAYLCGMTRNLGEVLAAYYLPAQYAKILGLMKKRVPRSTACLQVLRFTFDDLGAAVARYWGMPDRVTECVMKEFSPGSRNAPENLLLAAVSLGHQMTTAVYRIGPKNESRLKMCLGEYSSVLPQAQTDAEDILKNAIKETQECFAACGMAINELRLEAQTRRAVEAYAPVTPDGREKPTGLEAAEAAPALERLAQETITLLSSNSDFELNTLILMVLEAILRGGRFDRALFAFLNPDRTQVEGRIGLGDGVESLIRKFQFQFSTAGGPVAAALLCKRIVAGAGDGEHPEAAKLSAIFGSSYLGLLPIVVAHQAVGCIYMENTHPRPGLNERELHVLQELCVALTSALGRLRNAQVAPNSRRGLLTS